MSSTKLHTSLFAALTLCLLLPTACRQADDTPVVARVYGHELHASDLVGIVPSEVSADDSAAIISQYIDQWVRQTVILAKAEKNVKNDFTRELGEYRNSLLTYAYERQIVDQLLDTVVTQTQMREYYDNHRSDFQLKNSIVKAVYVIAPKRSAAAPALKNLVNKRVFSDAEVVDMEQLATRHHLKGYYDADTWMPFYSLQAAVPITTYNENLFLKQNHSIVLSDDSLTYFVRIINYRVADDISPLDMEKQSIRSIIINHRKVELLAKMQADLMAEAERAGEIHVTGRSDHANEPEPNNRQ